MAANDGPETIIEAVKDRLSLITEASGYSCTPRFVKWEIPPALGEISKGQLPALYVVDGDEERDHTPCTYSTNIYTLEIYGFCDEPKGNTRELRRLIRDVKKCLQATAALAVGTWETGRAQVERGLLVNIRVDWDREISQSMFVAEFQVTYREPLALS